MGMCKGCGEVYPTQEMLGGYCVNCKPEIKDKIQNLEEYNKASKEISEEIEKEKEKNQTCGIISAVLSIIGIFFAPIIFEPIAFICGFMNIKSVWGKIGLIISSIFILIALLGLIGIGIAMNSH